MRKTRYFTLFLQTLIRIKNLKRIGYIFIILFLLSCFNSVLAFTGKDGETYPEYQISSEEQAIYLFDGTTLSVAIAPDSYTIAYAKTLTTSISHIAILNNSGKLASTTKVMQAIKDENGNFSEWMSNSNFNQMDYSASTSVVWNTKELGFNYINNKWFPYHLLANNLPNYIDVTNSNIICENLDKWSPSIYVAPKNTVWVLGYNNKITCKSTYDGEIIPFTKYNLTNPHTGYLLTAIAATNSVTSTTGTVDKIYSHFGDIVYYNDGRLFSKDMRDIFEYRNTDIPDVEEILSFTGKDGKMYPEYTINNGEQAIYLFDGTILHVAVVPDNYNISYSRNDTTLVSRIVITNNEGKMVDTTRTAYATKGEDGYFSAWISSSNFSQKDYSAATYVVGNTNKLRFNYMTDSRYPYYLEEQNLPNYIDLTNSNIICENLDQWSPSIYVAPENTIWVLDNDNKITCRLTYDGENIPFTKYNLTNPHTGYSLTAIAATNSVTSTTGTVDKICSHFGDIVHYNDGSLFSEDMRYIFNQYYIPHETFLNKLRHFGIQGVDGFTGNYSNTYNDFKIEIPNVDLSFSRTYNSRNEQSGVLGRGWTFGFDSKIEKSQYDSTRVYVYLPNGSINSFIKKNNGSYEGENTRNKLELNNNQYVLTTKEQTKYIFNSDNLLCKIIDKYLNETDITINSEGEITKIKDCVGREYTINYQDGKMIQIIDPLNRMINYNYDTSGMLSEVIDTYGKSTYYEYDEQGYMKSEKIKNSDNQLETIKEMTYIDNGEYKKLETIIDSAGKKDTYTYNTDGSTSIQDQNGRIVNKYYDAQGYCIKQIEPDGLETIVNYNLINNNNRFGEINYKKEITGNITTYERDNNGNIIKQINVDNSYKLYEYNEKNSTTKVIDENGNVISYEYYPDGITLKSKTMPSGTKITYEYTDTPIKGLISKEIDLENNQIQYEYDNFGNVNKITDGRGNTKIFSYNNIGWKMSETDDNNNITLYEYNNAGQITKITKNAGQTSEFKVYDNKGKVIQETNANGDNISYKYNTAGEIIEKIDEENNKYQYEYDIYCNKVKEILPNNVIYKYEYDNTNRKTKKIIEISNNDTLLEEYSYEYSDGNKMTTTKQYINSTEFSTTQVLKNYLDKVVNEKIEQNQKTYTYLANGELATQENEIGQRIYYSYNADNQLTTVFEEIENNQFKRIDYEYNILGRKVKEKITQELVSLNESSENFIEKTYVYDANGNVTQESNSTGQEIKYTYDGNNNVIKQEEKMEENKYKVTEYEYNYANNPIKKKEIINKNSLASPPDIQSNEVKLETTYEYDNMQNLIKETSPGGIKISYTFNKLNKQIKKETSKGDKNIIEEKQYDNVGNIISTKDANGNLTTYEYNELNHMTKKNQQNNIITQYEVDLLGHTIKEILPNQIGTDNCIRYEYNKNGFKIKMIKGNETTINIATLYTYDGIGNLLSETTENIGKTYTYNKAGKPITFTDENGNTTTYTYDVNLNLIAEMNPKNVQTTYTYDSNNKELTKKIAGILQNENTYDLIGNLTSSKDELGKIIVYEYDNNGNVIKQTDQYETIFKYDLDKKMVNKVDSNQKETTYTYDILGNTIKETEQKEDGTQSITIIREFDNLSNKIKEIDGNGNATEYTYNVFNKITSEKNPKNQVTIYEYDKNGNIIKETNYLQNTIKYVYDSLDRLIETINEYDQKIEKLEYDIHGRQTKSIDANNNCIEYTYDNMGNILNKKDEEGNIEYFEYDVIGNKTKYTNKNGETTKYFYTNKNELSKIENALGEITMYTYDNAGNLIEQKDAVGNTIKYEYDLNGNEVKEIDANNNIELKEYNTNGTLKKRITRNGDIFTYQYDIHNNLIKETVGENIIEYEYDKNSNIVKTIKNGNVDTTRTYDSLNRVITKNGAVYEYDIVLDDGEYKEKSIDEKGNIVETIYDKAKRIIKVINENDETTYSYNANGSLNKITYSNGTREEYVYNLDNTLKKLTNTNLNGTIISEYEYEYDKNNNIIKKIDEQVATNYQYDALNRIIGISKDGKTTLYEYDTRGNRTKENTVEQEKNTVTTYTYNNNNQLIEKTLIISGSPITEAETVQYEYDLNGNEIREKINGQVTLENTYNEKNELIATQGETHTATYEYNAEGQRTKKTIDNITTQFVYEGTNAVLELDETGNEIAKNIYGLALISRKMDNKKGYYLYNGHGDVTTIIDSNNNILNTYNYDEFGQIKNESGTFDNPWRYAGYYYDKETNNYYLQSRYYNPKIARFISEDTYIGDLEDSLSLNRYTYANNNPLIYNDPDGHFALPVPVVMGIIGGTANTLFHIGADIINGNDLDFKSYLGDFAEGFIEGGALGLLGPNAGILKTVATGFGAGMLGNTTNQLISNGDANLGQSLVAGITSAVGIGSFGIGDKVASSNESISKLVNYATKGIVSGMTSDATYQLLTKDTKDFDIGETIISGAIGGVTAQIGPKVTKNVVNKLVSSVYTVEVEGKTITINNKLFNAKTVNKDGIVNIKNMKKGKAAIGKDGKSINIHHINQKDEGPFIELLATVHQKKDKELHPYAGVKGYKSQIDRSKFNSWREKYWRWRAENINYIPENQKNIGTIIISIFSSKGLQTTNK